MQDQGKFARLEWFFWELVRSMAKIPRWENKDHPRHTKENVLEHSFKTWMLTLLVILLEKRAGNHKLDAVWLLIRAPGHDLEESCGVGDKPFFIRHHPRVKQLFDKLGEELIHMFLCEHLPPEVADAIFNLLTSDDVHEIEVEIFKYIERLGYVTFALYEIQQAGHPTFYKVLRDHFDILERGGKEFPDSIGIIWGGMKPTIISLLAKKDNK